MWQAQIWSRGAIWLSSDLQTNWGPPSAYTILDWEVRVIMDKSQK